MKSGLDSVFFEFVSVFYGTPRWLANCGFYRLLARMQSWSAFEKFTQSSLIIGINILLILGF